MWELRKRFHGHHWAVLVVIVSLVLVVPACGSQQAEKPQGTQAATNEPPITQPSNEKTVGDSIIYASISDASTFNPILSNDTSSGDVIDRIFEGIVTTNDKFEWIPELAEDFSFSEDGKDWTFHLRHNVKWQDGEAFTAKDVEFTFQAIMHPDYEGSRRGNYDKFLGFTEYDAALQQISKDLDDKKITADEAEQQKLDAFETWKQAGAIEVVDDYTIKFHLTDAFAPFMNSIAMEILPGHVFDWNPGEAGKQDNPFNSESPVGTGPYKFVKWTRNEEVVLEANPDYWGEGPYVKTFIMRVIPDQQVVTSALETGDVDLGNIQLEDWDRMTQVDHLKTYEYTALSYTYMGYNLLNPLFQDVRVRRALTHAIDREAIVEQLLLGHGIVANSHGSPARWDYNPDVPVYEYDPDKARSLLAEAGWSDSDGDGVLDKDGQKFHFTIQTNQGNKLREDSAGLIRDALKEVGIEVETSFVEWDTLVNEVLLAKNYEAAIVGWSLGIDPDSYSIWHTNGGPLNFVSFSDPTVDSLLEEGRVTMDESRRKEIYAQVQEILAEQQPYTFLYFPSTLMGLDSRFEGPIDGTTNGILWNENEWYVPVDKQLRNE